MPYTGVIIEESLEDTRVLKSVSIIKTEVEAVTASHVTPWVKQWTMHSVSVSQDQVDLIAKKLSVSLDSVYPWYADLKNETYHYIIFKNKVFFVDRSRNLDYDEARRFGLALGIPKHQLDFS